jgi:hypothetical protein
MADSFYDTIEGRIELLFNRQVMEFECEASPLFNTMISSEGTFKGAGSGGFSRNWYVRKLLEMGDNGYFEMDGASGTTINGDNIGNNELFYFLDQTNTEAPDPNLAVAGLLTVEMQIPLRAGRGVLTRSLDEKRQQMNDGYVGEEYAKKMMRAARGLTRQRAGMLFADDEYGLIATISSVTNGTGTQPTSTSDYTEYEVTIADSKIDAFHTAMPIQITTSAGVSKGTYYVKNVDRGDFTLRVYKKGDLTATSGDDLEVGDKIYANNGAPVSTQSYSVDGINAHIKDSGTIYNVDISLFPQLRSYIKTGQTGPLTETRLNKWLDHFKFQHECWGNYIDTLILNSATRRAWVEQEQSYYTKERARQPMTLAGQGDDGVTTYVHDGDTYKIYVDNAVKDGRLHGLRLGGQNYTRYTPPSTPGTDTAGMPGHTPVEFWARFVTDNNSIFVPKWGSNNRLTRVSYAPFDYRMNVVPDQMAALRIDGLSVSRDSL